jgi:hypothetical protein
MQARDADYGTLFTRLAKTLTDGRAHCPFKSSTLAQFPVSKTVTFPQSAICRWLGAVSRDVSMSLSKARYQQLRPELDYWVPAPGYY